MQFDERPHEGKAQPGAAVLRGAFMYSDEQHLSIAGSLALAQQLIAEHENFMAPPATLPVLHARAGSGP